MLFLKAGCCYCCFVCKDCCFACNDCCCVCDNYCCVCKNQTINYACDCREFQRKVLWLTPGDAAHQVLCKLLAEPRTLQTLRMLNHGQHTGSLENLHSLILSYAPKRLDFDPPSYRMRVQLAVIDHNSNVGRQKETGKL